MSIGVSGELFWLLRRRAVIAYEIGAIRRNIIENRFDMSRRDKSLIELIGLPRSWMDGSFEKLSALRRPVVEYLAAPRTKLAFVELASRPGAECRFEEMLRGIEDEFDRRVEMARRDAIDDAVRAGERQARDMDPACASCAARAIMDSECGFLTGDGRPRGGGVGN